MIREELDYEEGKENLNGTAENSAKLGDQLLAPEIGWNRYDNENSKIVYDEIIEAGEGVGTYKDGFYWLEENKPMKFKFEGSKIRILSAINTLQRTHKVQVQIDGEVVDIFNQGDKKLSTGSKYQRICYEKLDLDYCVHEVVITNIDNAIYPGPGISWRALEIDAIDIDGHLIEMEESSCNKDEALLILKMLSGQTEDYYLSQEELEYFLDAYSKGENITFKRAEKSFEIDETIIRDHISTYKIIK